MGSVAENNVFAKLKEDTTAIWKPHNEIKGNEHLETGDATFRAVETFLSNNDILKRDNMGEYLDKRALLQFFKNPTMRVSDYSYTNPSRHTGSVTKKLNYVDIFRYLYKYQKSGRVIIDTEDSDNRAPTVVALPYSLNDILRDDIQIPGIWPWEMGQKVTSWKAEFILDSGEQVTMAELYLHYLIKKYSIVRNSEGRLSMTADGITYPFSAERLHGLGILLPTVTDEVFALQKRQIKFNNDPVLFLHVCAPSLLDRGIFQESDFRMSAGSLSERYLGYRTVPITAQSEDVYFTTKKGSARYYFGKGTYITGTDFSRYRGTGPERVHRDLYIMKIDDATAVIVEKDTRGSMIPRLIFPLLGFEIPVRTHGPEALQSSSIPSAEVRLNADYMKENLRKYNPADIIEQLPNETQHAYIDRVAGFRFDDVIKSTRVLFREAGISIHTLPWKDQYAITRATLNESDSTRLVNFAKKYGIAGLRVLAATTTENRDFLDQLLSMSLAESNDTEATREIFGAYCRIINDLQKIDENIIAMFPDADSETIGRYQRMTRFRQHQKGMQLLYQYIDKTLDQSQVLAGIEKMHLHVLFLKSTYKYLYEQNVAPSPGELVEMTQRVESLHAMSDITYNQYADECYKPSLNRSPKLCDYLSQRLHAIRRDQNHSADFHGLYHDNTIAGGFVSQELHTGHIRVSALSGNEVYQGGALLLGLLATYLHQVKSDNIIHAECVSNNPITPSYISMGFIGIKPFDISFPGERTDALTICLNDSLNQDLVTKQWDPQSPEYTELLNRAVQSPISVDALSRGIDTGSIMVKGPLSDLQDPMDRNGSAPIAKLNQLVLGYTSSSDKRYILTQYHVDRDANTYHMVYEAVTNDFVERYQAVMSSAQ